MPALTGLLQVSQARTILYNRALSCPAIPDAASQNARPFFSRRIGLSTTGALVGINAGAKINGRIGDWNMGTPVINQMRTTLLDSSRAPFLSGRPC